MNPTPVATEEDRTPSGEVRLPAPTTWPIVLAFGITLLFAGLVTSAAVSVLGAALLMFGSVGWFRDVFPEEKEETVKAVEPSSIVSSIRHEVERLPIAPELPRALLPLETYPVSAGIKGGLVGGATMAVVACLYGLLKQGSIWYPINLLGAAVYVQTLKLGSTSLSAFHWQSFLLAVVIHLVTSTLVGLLYGAILPMFPRRPILLGGLFAPILWTGLLYGTLGLIDPLLNQLIDWRWFIVSQFGYGIVAGLVVVKQERVRVRQFLPFLERAGVEAPGLTDEKHAEDGSR
jgi:hypothetical protein